MDLVKEFMKEKEGFPDKRVLICAADLSGPAHYRALLPCFGMTRNKLCKVVVSTFIDDIKFKWKPHVVVFCRQHRPEIQMAMRIFKNQGARIVYDTDDNLINIHPNNPARYGFTQTRQEIVKLRDKQTGKVIKEKEINITVKQDVLHCLRLSDVMTVSTEPLKNAYSEFCKNIQVLPNSLLSSYSYLSFPKKDSKIRIGYAGSSTHYHDIKIALYALKEIVLKNKNVVLVFMGYAPDYLKDNIPPDQLEIWPATEIGDYHLRYASLRLDIGIAPLHDNIFNAGKSNLKVIENGALSIPTVASPIYPYLNTIEDGIDGLIVKKNKDSEWIKCLQLLIDNKELRLSMGAKIKEKVMREYNVETNAHLWYDAYFKDFDFEKFDEKFRKSQEDYDNIKLVKAFIEKSVELNLQRNSRDSYRNPGF
jgi:glycosyltransferase involved in cell wall biosynthesis